MNARPTTAQVFARCTEQIPMPAPDQPVVVITYTGDGTSMDFTVHTNLAFRLPQQSARVVGALLHTLAHVLLEGVDMRTDDVEAFLARVAEDGDR